MTNLYQIVTAITNIGDAHPEITRTVYGDNIKIDDEQESKYPVMHIASAPSTIQKGAASISINITILDLPPERDETQLETDSKAFAILADVIGEFQNGFTYINQDNRDVSIDEDVSVDPIAPQPDYNDRLIGWSGTVNVNVSYSKSGCNDNIINLESNTEFSKAFSLAFS